MLVENGSLQDVSGTRISYRCLHYKYVIDLIKFETKYDLTRGTKTNLFDMYYDKFKQGLKDIQYGQGTVSPKLWGYRSKQATKKKRRKG